MTNKERQTLAELCDRIYYGEEIDVDTIDAYDSLYHAVKHIIQYKPSKKRLIRTLTDNELLKFKEYEQRK